MIMLGAIFSGAKRAAGAMLALALLTSATAIPTPAHAGNHPVGTNPSETSVSSTPNPSEFGKTVVITAAVGPLGQPTGTVAFTSNGAAISGCSAQVIASGMATCSTATLAVGSDTIVGTYSGDSNFMGSSGSTTQVVNGALSLLQFVPVTPCRVVDTRQGAGLVGGTPMMFTIPDGLCSGIPVAAAYSLNVTAIPEGELGYLTIWAAGEAQPSVSLLNSPNGVIKANAAIVPASSTGAVEVYASNNTNLLLDINGYFETATAQSLQFFPVPPCRLVDTRTANSSLGGPILAANTERDFPLEASTACPIPSQAVAFSLNFTAIPSGEALGYLTVWAQGQPQPTVSTLNDSLGITLANAAIVPAGAKGGVAVYPSAQTNLLIDVNGYFAALTGGDSLVTVPPCRVLDTRTSSGAFTGKLTIDVTTSTCAVAASATAYVFNATAIPVDPLGFLTLWADGATQPGVSTLNAPNGVITSNMAIVPNMDGNVDAFASQSTQLLLDISAYFVP
jgi:Bacterial Ig-like domain (group 3)